MLYKLVLKTFKIKLTQHLTSAVQDRSFPVLGSFIIAFDLYLCPCLGHTWDNCGKAGRLMKQCFSGFIAMLSNSHVMPIYYSE